MLVEISTLPEEPLQEGDAILFVRLVDGVPQPYRIAGGLIVSNADGSVIINGHPAISFDPTSQLMTLNVGNIVVTGDFPTDDPGVKGQCWNNGGYLCISAGQPT